MFARWITSRRSRITATLLGCGLILAAARGAAGDKDAFDPLSQPIATPLSVMTYNVEGLPWPARINRRSALLRMANRLQALRAAGRQPHIVLLQEVFSDDAREMARSSGYAFLAFGPSADSADSRTTSRSENPDRLRGEGVGKLLDSGLVILSDYPIGRVRSIAFADACAGFDCLANKAAMAAEVELPGSNGRVTIVNLHLNARKASGVAVDRANAAYGRQALALGRFLKALTPARPLIVAGDFNIGRSTERQALIAEALRFRASGPLADALSRCVAAVRPCPGGTMNDAIAANRRGKDRQFLFAGAHSSLAVRAVSVPFGREPDGTMLSDHVGYVGHFDVVPQDAPMPSKTERDRLGELAGADLREQDSQNRSRVTRS
ncbi:MAG: endonuclease/exonuclease/phosphatase family protein [Pseudomonadota bacterium]